jgi:hypothetical protein
VFDLNNPEVVRLEEERRRRDIFDSMRSPLTAQASAQDEVPPESDHGEPTADARRCALPGAP